VKAAQSGENKEKRPRPIHFNLGYKLAEMKKLDYHLIAVEVNV
jgi:hypothetical protein